MTLIPTICLTTSKFVYDNISSANILIFLVNMKDLLAMPDCVNELMDLDQMFHTLNQRSDIPRKMAVVFSQFDKYKPEVDQQFNGDFLEYIRHYIPLLHGQYIRKRNFEIIPVAAVNDTRDVIENGEVKQYPVPGFSSYNLETLIHWIADSVEELAPAIYEYNLLVIKNQISPDSSERADSFASKVAKIVRTVLLYLIFLGAAPFIISLLLAGILNWIGTMIGGQTCGFVFGGIGMIIGIFLFSFLSAIDIVDRLEQKWFKK